VDAISVLTAAAESWEALHSGTGKRSIGDAWDGVKKALQTQALMPPPQCPHCWTRCVTTEPGPAATQMRAAHGAHLASRPESGRSPQPLVRCTRSPGNQHKRLQHPHRKADRLPDELRVINQTINERE